MLLNLAQWVQTSEAGAWIAGSTWAVPLVGALHVLGIAWFAGAALLSALRAGDEGPRPRAAFLWAGGVFMLASGALLFIAEPVRCVNSYSFRAKMLLLVILAVATRIRSKIRAPLILALWAGVLLAARGIAYF